MRKAGSGIPRQLTFLIDKREKYPLSFPKFLRWKLGSKTHLIKVVTEIALLPTADYAVKDHL